MLHLTIKARFMLIVMILISGFSIFGVLTAYVLNTVSVNGPVYKRIVEGKDIVADVLPPPEYIIESFLTTLQMSTTSDPNELAEMERDLGILEKDYHTRHHYWQAQLLEPNIAIPLLDTSYQAAIAFYEETNRQFLPALHAGNTQQMHASLQKLHILYDQHRKAINEVVRVTNARNSEDEARTVEQIAFYKFGLSGIFILSVLLSILVTVFISNGILKSLKLGQQIASEIAAGDLRHDHEIEQQDEVGDLLRSVKAMQGSLRQMISHIASNAFSIASISSQLNVLADQVKNNSVQQSHASQNVASAVEEMTVSIAQITHTAGESEHLVEQAGFMASEGYAVVNDATHEMGKIADTVTGTSQIISELGNSSRQITEIVEVINSIANQTNLLALNAAIEAARAGVQGRGFAVVAEEVRKLAERTAQSTQEVTTMIDTIQRNADNAVASMEKGSLIVTEGVVKAQRAGDSINQIKFSTDNVIATTANMSQALKTQNMVVNQIAQDIEHIASMVVTNNGAVKELASVALSLAKMANTLQSSVSEFKV